MPFLPSRVSLRAQLLVFILGYHCQTITYAPSPFIWEVNFHTSLSRRLRECIQILCRCASTSENIDEDVNAFESGHADRFGDKFCSEFLELLGFFGGGVPGEHGDRAELLVLVGEECSRQIDTYIEMRWRKLGRVRTRADIPKLPVPPAIATLIRVIFRTAKGGQGILRVAGPL